MNRSLAKVLGRPIGQAVAYRSKAPIGVLPVYSPIGECTRPIALIGAIA